MTYPGRPLVVGAIGLAALALCLAALPLLLDRRDGDGPAGTAIDEARIARLEEEIARLRERGGAEGDGARQRVNPPGGDAAAAAEGSTGDRLAALEAAVADLTGSLDETEQRVDALAESGSKDPMQAIREATPSPEQVAELRALALNEEAEDRPRILAVRALARVDGGRTLEVARAMRKMHDESDEEWVRTASVAMLEGFVDAELEPWLVDVLLEDKYSSTRESATDVLSHYTGSQRVREALADAAANDTNYDVRADAQNALDKIDEREGQGR